MVAAYDCVETVLSLRLTVASDLEPNWSLVSDRSNAQGLSRNLSWGDRVRLAPTRIGAIADYHLGWRRGSVLQIVAKFGDIVSYIVRKYE